MKQCPYCAEEIKEAAVVCRYCDRELPDEYSTKKLNLIGKLSRGEEVEKGENISSKYVSGFSRVWLILSSTIWVLVATGVIIGYALNLPNLFQQRKVLYTREDIGDWRYIEDSFSGEPKVCKEAEDLISKQLGHYESCANRTDIDRRLSISTYLLFFPAIITYGIVFLAVITQRKQRNCLSIFLTFAPTLMVVPFIFYLWVIAP